MALLGSVAVAVVECKTLHVRIVREFGFDRVGLKMKKILEQVLDRHLFNDKRTMWISGLPGYS